MNLAQEAWCLTRHSLGMALPWPPVLLWRFLESVSTNIHLLTQTLKKYFGVPSFICTRLSKLEISPPYRDAEKLVHAFGLEVTVLHYINKIVLNLFILGWTNIYIKSQYIHERIQFIQNPAARELKGTKNKICGTSSHFGFGRLTPPLPLTLKCSFSIRLIVKAAIRRKVPSHSQWVQWNVMKVMALRHSLEVAVVVNEALVMDFCTLETPDCTEAIWWLLVGIQRWLGADHIVAALW